MNARSVMMSLCFAGCFMSSITRYNINIAIIAMVTTSSVETSTNETHVPPNGMMRFNWDPEQQGLILGSLFYTYIMFQVPTGVIAERIGASALLSISLIASAVINIATPFIAGSIYILISSRLLLGVMQASGFPASYALLNQWTPDEEKAFAFSLLRAGAQFGSVVSSLGSGYLSQHLGWMYVFWISGMLSLAVGIVNLFLMKDTPEKCRWISTEELDLISLHRGGGENKSSSRIKIPWVKLLSSPAILSALVFKFAYYWIFFLITSTFPSYLSRERGLDIGSDGLAIAAFNLCYAVSLSLTGSLATRLICRCSRTRSRKLFALVTGVGSAVCVSAVPMIESPYLMLALVYLCGLFLGFSSGADVPLPAEMSHNFPATIFGIINMGMISGSICPSAAGWMIAHYEPPLAWILIFSSASVLMITTTLIFTLFASAERLDFDIEIEPNSDRNSW